MYKRKVYKRFGVAAVLIVAASALASPPWFVRTWQSDEGLLDNTVSGIEQSPDGFIWVATHTGLVRFDGVQFREFPLHTPGIEARTIQAFCSDRRGRLWVAREPGVILCLDQGRITVMYVPDNTVPNRRVASLVEDGEGTVWASFVYGGLLQLKDGKARFCTTEDGLPASGVTAMTVDRGGQLWFLHAGRVGVFRGGRFLTLGEAPFSFIRAARDEGVWLAKGTTLARYTQAGGLSEKRELNAEIVQGELTAFFEDRSGRLWFGTRLAGLFCDENEHVVKADASHQTILCIDEDQEGNIWVGTRGGGVKQLNPRVAELLTTSGSAPFEGIQSLCKDTEEQLWAINWSKGKVQRNIDGAWVPFSAREGWTIPFAKCVAAEPRGGVWIGTQQHGLFLWQDGAATRHFSATNGLVGNYVNALRTTPAGAVWIGGETNERQEAFLQCWKEGAFQTFKLPSNGGGVMAIEVDASGDCWVATHRGRLLRVRGTVVTDETQKLLPEPYPIRALLAMPDSSLWIGFAGRGLGRLKDGQFTHCRKGQGIPDDFISQILSDGYGRLWFAGNRGVFSLREKDWDVFAEGRDTLIHSVVYRQKDGQPGLQASCDAWPGAFRDNEGRLYFAMQSGVATFYPEAIKDDPLPPTVVIDRVLANGKVVALYGAVKDVLPEANDVSPLELGQVGAELSVPLGKRQVEFYFTAPAFTMPESVRFKYQLKGLDQEWIDAGPRRSVLYSQLGPGHYTFQVIACNRDGVWNTQGVSLALTVAPFWWETAWFRVGGPLCAFGIVGGLVVAWLRRRQKLRIERLELQQVMERERVRIAQDLHDDLGAGLTEIGLLGDLMESQKTYQPDTVSLITKRARELAGALDEIVWAVNPRHDNSQALTAYFCRFAQDFLRPAGLACRFDVAELLPEGGLTIETRHQVFLAFKEALNNIVRHARATEVSLRFVSEKGQLVISVTDNGCGFSGAESTGSPDGVQGMCDRLARLGGECAVHSVPGKGVSVTFSLPIKGGS